MSNLYDLKIGLVLAGGGAKGAYQGGVLKALWDLDLIDHVTVVSSVSVGTLNALMMCMKQRELVDLTWQSLTYSKIMTRAEGRRLKDIGEFVKRVKAYRESGRLEPFDVSTTGFISQKGIRKYIETFVDVKVIQEADLDVYSCAYNLEEEKPEYFKLNDFNEEEIIDITIGSCAVPFVFLPVEFKGKQYADGGVNSPLYRVHNADNIPIKPIIENGHECDLIIVVHLNYHDQIDRTLYPHKQVIEIYPTSSLEVINGSGTLNFYQGAIKGRMNLGYRDGLAALAPLAIKYLKGECIQSYIENHNEKNKCLVKKKE